MRAVRGPTLSLLTPLLLVRTAAAQAPEPLDLEAAVGRASARAVQMYQAKADLLLADVEKMRALSPILPRLDLSASAGLQAGVDLQLTNPIRPDEQLDPQSYSAGGYQLGLQLRQLIYDGGRWWTVIAQAGDVERQAKAALVAAQNDVRLAVAERFYGVEKAARSLETFDAQIAVGEEQLKRVRAMLETGLGKRADVAAVEGNLAADRIQRARLKLQLAAAERELWLVMGEEPGKPLKLVMPPGLASPPVVALASRDALVEKARAARPEVERSRAQLEHQRRGVDVLRAAYWPTLALSGSYTKQSTKPELVFGLPTENFTVQLGLGLSWNLFAGRGDQAQVERAELELGKSEEQHAALLRTLVGEVEAALEGVRLQLEVLELASQASGAAEEAVRLARGNYEQGRGTLLELRDAELRQLQTRLTAIQARLDLEIARESLLRATGGEGRQ